MKNNTYLKYLAEFFLEWEMFQRKVVDKMKTHFISNNFYSEDRAFY